MNKIINTCIVAILLCSHVFGQFDEVAFNKKMEMKSNLNTYSWKYKNVFYDYKVGVASEVFIEPVRTFKYLHANYPGDTDLEQVTLVDANFMMSIFNFTMEPRVNVYSKNNYSIFLKTPITAGLSLNNDREGGNIIRGAGVFNLTVPLLIGYGKGLNSTFSNTSRNGFAISAGYQLLITPVVGGKAHRLITEQQPYTPKYQSYIPVGEAYKIKRAWLMPVIQFDYYHYNRKQKIRGFSFTFCPYGNLYFKAALNFVGKKK